MVRKQKSTEKPRNQNEGCFDVIENMGTESRDEQADPLSVKTSVPTVTSSTKNTVGRQTWKRTNRTLVSVTPQVRWMIQDLFEKGTKLEVISSSTKVSLSRICGVLSRNGVSKEKLRELKQEAVQRRAHGRRKTATGKNGFCAADERAIQARSGGKCECCKVNPGKVRDHIVPIQMSGKTEVNNTQLLCENCNAIKTHYVDRMLRAYVLARRGKSSFATKSVYLYNALAEVLRLNGYNDLSKVDFKTLRAARDKFFTDGSSYRLKKGGFYGKGSKCVRAFLRNEFTEAMTTLFYTLKGPVQGAAWSIQDLTELDVTGGRKILVKRVIPEYCDKMPVFHPSARAQFSRGNGSRKGARSF